MKILKLFVVAAIAVMTLCFVSCGGNNEATTSSIDSTNVVVIDETALTEDLTPDAVQSPEEIKSAIEAAKTAGDDARVKELIELWESKIKELKALGDEDALKSFSDALNIYCVANKALLKDAGVNVENAIKAAKVIDAISGGKASEIMEEAAQEAEKEMDKAAKETEEEMEKSMNNFGF